jgi:hypothetical protein
VVQASIVLEAGKRLLTKPWTYAGAAVIALVVATSMALGGVGSTLCSDSPAQLGGRLGELQKTYATIYQEASAEIQACQSLDCERPAKLEIAAALGSYNQGLGYICWPVGDQSLIKALSAANSAEAVAYNGWADAATPADDQLQAIAVRISVKRQQVAARAAAARVHP